MIHYNCLKKLLSSRLKANLSLFLCGLFYFSYCLFLVVRFWLALSPAVAANGPALGEEADFEVLNCLPALNLIRSIEFQLSTEPAFLPNACYVFALPSSL